MARKSRAWYPREQLPAVAGVQRRGPWKNRAARIRSLLAFRIGGGGAWVQPLNDAFELAKLDDKGEDRLCEVLCAGLVARLREQERTEQTTLDREVAVRIQQLHRDLPPLLESLRHLVNDPELTEATRLVEASVRNVAAEAAWKGPRRRPRRGNPLRTVLRTSREGLSRSGVKNREAQTHWLELVGLLEA